MAKKPKPVTPFLPAPAMTKSSRFPKHTPQKPYAPPERGANPQGRRFVSK